MSAVSLQSRAFAVALGILVVHLALFAGFVHGWDSDNKGNFTHATHSYLTEWSVDQLRAQYPELQEFRQQLIEGANQELHELPVTGTRYGVDLNTIRRAHEGTNEGCNDIEAWWKDSRTAYKAGEKRRAYFLVGVMLHMIQDMGVPAHANGVHHQASIKELDHFARREGRARESHSFSILLTSLRALPVPDDRVFAFTIRPFT